MATKVIIEPALHDVRIRLRIYRPNGQTVDTTTVVDKGTSQYIIYVWPGTEIISISEVEYK